MHLIDELPSKITNKYNNNKLNLVLEGGLFNGSYLTGCLFYLKELQNRNYIKINKISGCSIGSLIALLYFIEDEEIILNIYKLAYNHFKENYNVNIFNKIFEILDIHLPLNILNLIQNKVYITYYNVKTSKQVVKSKYKTLNDLFESIRRSCSFPYVVDNNIFYKNKYVDGFSPFIFPKKNNCKTLYLNLHHYNKISGMISVKNENTNIPRVLEGVIEIHIFFNNETPTSICSFVNDWTKIDYLTYYVLLLVIKVFVFLLNKVYIIKKLLKSSKINNKFNINKLGHQYYKYLLNCYCI
jgi:hypothetical protein